MANSQVRNPTAKPLLQRGNVDGIPAIALENEHLRAVVLPDCGGKIVSLFCRRFHCEWLWRNPHMPLRVPPAGTTRYVQEFDNGGWDECFPTIAPGVLPSGPHAGKHVHDHGELWALPWRVEACDECGGVARLVLSAEAPFLSARVERTIMLSRNSPVLSLRYRLENLGDGPLPFIWAVHALIGLEPGMRIETPGGTEFQVSGWFPAGERSPAAPPALESDGSMNLPDGAPPPGSAWGLKGAFLGDFRQPIILRAADGAGFGYRFGREDFDGAALWVNNGYWSGCGSAPYGNLGFEPQIGLSDDLSAALREGTPHATLQPGDHREWKLDVILGTGEAP